MLPGILLRINKGERVARGVAGLFSVHSGKLTDKYKASGQLSGNLF